jgi:tetratricopeptide (TPR) repeat protein
MTASGVALDDSGTAFLRRGGKGGRGWLPVMLIVAAGLLAFANSFSGPFIFDDVPAIVENPTLQGLRRPSELLAPPALRGAGVAGRPMVNLSLALNRWISGDGVWSYHAFNLFVHLAAGLALFGVVRRTLAGQRMSRAGNESDAIATGTALLWVVHPLQTESVTCIIQRTESLSGLFYLLLFYAFARAVQGGSRWWLFAFAAGLAGAATKEVAVTAPWLLLLYDRTFVTGSFQRTWQERGRWHLALAISVSTIVALLLWRSEIRGGTVGFGHGVAWWEYAYTQCEAVVMYLKLVGWPHPLVLDYGTHVVRTSAAIWPQATLLACFAAATCWAIVRRPALGFLGAWLFVILAPSSSVVPLVTQTMAEHRMYLPLAALIAAAVVACRALTTRGFAVVIALATLAFMVATFARNRDYATAESIWRDNVAKRPQNARGHFTLAQLADEAGRSDEAIAEGEAAVRLLPEDASAHFNLAFSHAKAGRLVDAEAHYRVAAQLQPESPDAHINLGSVLIRQGRYDAAITEYETVARLRPSSAQDAFNLAQADLAAGRAADAIEQYEAVIRLTPGFAEAHYRMGNAWLKLQRLEEAVRAYREATRLDPNHFEAHVNLGGALLALGRGAEAVRAYEAALRLKPGDPQVTANLARARATAAR